MNWLDWTIIAALAWAAIKGFQRGFIVELASLVALVLGIWAAIHLSERVGAAIGLEADRTVLAFVVTLVLVLVAVHLLARFLTTLIDLAQLGLPNKLAGVLFGALRSAFTLSIALNLLLGYSAEELPPAKVRDGSELYVPVRAFAPVLVPALQETKWVKDAMERAKQEFQDLQEE